MQTEAKQRGGHEWNTPNWVFCENRSFERKENNKNEYNILGFVRFYAKLLTFPWIP